MIPLLTVAQMRAAEEALFTTVAPEVVMQRAARGLSDVCLRLLEAERGQIAGADVVLLVGTGNNGGDALLAGADLAARGCRVHAVQVGDRIHAEGLHALTRAGGICGALDEADAWMSSCDLVIDGVVGIGGRGAVDPRIIELLDGDPLTVAVDIPSGVDADTGHIAGAAVRADLTVTFGAVKPGLLLAPDHVGEIEVVDIGVTIPEEVALASLEASDIECWVPEPGWSDYKYSRGVVGVAAGSEDYPGAGMLVAAGARHANVGMVHVWGTGSDIVQVFPDVVRSAAPPNECARVTAWACGSGVTSRDVVSSVLETRLPVVLDAGALRIMSSDSAIRDAVTERTDRGITTVLTPHAGEFTALFPKIDAADRVHAARDAARRTGAIVVLKGAPTVIADPLGEVRIDIAGTPALACAGSGDVLSGILGGLAAGAQARGEIVDVDVISAGVWIHGVAGQVAAEGGRTVTATDIAAHVADAIAIARAGMDA
ncbi:MAG: NAD(P)H-hydrate dehydratase [Actinobacteria bacterium]|nr:NAD(P)H-hydrate dehydratase [Actinomycetota bacterium]